MNTASSNVAARKRVKAMHGAAARSLALALACVLAVANVAAAPLGVASASADDSGKQQANLTYQYVDLKFPKLAETGLVYDGTQKNGYVDRPEAILTVPGESDHSWQWPFYVEYFGINGTDYHPPKCYSNKDYQGINANAPVNAGDYRVIFSAPEDDAFADKPKLAFILNPNHIDFTIAKAPALTLAPLSASTIDAAEYRQEFDLASMLSLPADLNGGPTYAVVDNTANGLADVSVNSATGMLTLVSKGGAGLAASDTVTVALTNMGNYEDSTVQVNVSYTAKPDAAISGVQAATSLVYNGGPQAGYTGTSTAVYLPLEATEPATYDGPFDITYVGTAADGSTWGPTAQAPAAAGTYRVTFAVPDSAFFAGSLALDFAIEKAPLVFHAQNASMTAGGTVPALGYTVTGLKGADQVIQAPCLAVEGDTTKAGSCTIGIAGGTVDNQASYVVAYENATLTVSAAPAPEPKPTPDPSKPKALATTGDTVLPGLLALAAGTAALAVGVAAVRIRTKRRG